MFVQLKLICVIEFEFAINPVGALGALQGVGVGVAVAVGVGVGLPRFRDACIFAISVFDNAVSQIAAC